MSKIWLNVVTLLSVLFLANTSGNSASQSKQSSEALNGTLQKLIVENASVTIQLDLNGLNGSSSLVARPVTLHFAAAPNSFFPVLVFNDLLRGLQPGSITLALQDSSSAGVIPLRQGDGGQDAPGYNNLPSALRSSLKRLTVEKLPSGQGFELAVRDSNTGFTFFNIEGHEYNYDAAGQSFTITGGRLLISKQFASTLGIPSETGSLAGTISIGAAMRPIQIDQLVRGETKSMVMPAMQHAVGPDTPNLVPGPDVIVGNVEDVAQFTAPVGTQVGLAIGTDSCNNGDQPIDWFALPQTDHPVVPQNLYRMSGGANNDARFEQIGQSWMKHTFLALEQSVCGTCNTSGCQTGSHLCPGCSDPYTSGLNGDQGSIGSRAWINPFTGSFPSNANNHNNHIHDGVSHRILVETSDLIPGQNVGASYFGEAAYISPHEYTWCQSHPTQCNMFNNYSYRQFSVTGGPSFFGFPAVGSTVRMQAAILAWAVTGATVNPIQPDPGNDGIWLMGYKITSPSAGVWHYEYALFNQNLDRGIQSFSVALNAGVNISNIGFHAPPQHPGWANDGTFNNQGYSSTPWSVTQTSDSITWNTETFAQNQNANAIRWGTLYNFRFDADQPPQTASATVGFFKTGSPMMVAIQGPAGGSPTPTPTATATSCSVDITNLPCGSTINSQPTVFDIDVFCPVDPTTVHLSSFTVNNIQPDGFSLLNGNMTIRFQYTTSPVVQGSNTMHIPAGGFNCVCGPVLEFTCTFSYQAPTPTPTATATATPTATSTPMPTATPRPTPSPRSGPLPRPRPTPLPRP
jgi:hypothetical protein